MSYVRLIALGPRRRRGEDRWVVAAVRTKTKRAIGLVLRWAPPRSRPRLVDEVGAATGLFTARWFPWPDECPLGRRVAPWAGRLLDGSGAR